MWFPWFRPASVQYLVCGVAASAARSGRDRVLAVEVPSVGGSRIESAQCGRGDGADPHGGAAESGGAAPLCLGVFSH